MPQGQLRVRNRIVWTPVWGKEYEGYAANFYRQNKWRCDPLYEMRDLIQDAYLIFAKIKMTYPRVIEAKHFMALYKRALANNMHDKSSYKRRKDAVEIYLSSDVSDFCAGRIGEITNAGYLAALIDEMPEELRMALQLLANGLPAEVKEKGLQPRESLTMQIRRILRFPINSDPLAMIKRILS